MATDNEAREATEGEEVAVEAGDSEAVHLQTNLDRKLQSNVEIKNMGKIIDTMEGTFKIPEDEVLVEAPSEVNILPEHSLNGPSSSLNGHMDKEDSISDDQPHEDSPKDEEQVEAVIETSTNQSNIINKEELSNCSIHEESTTDDRSLLKHVNEEIKEGDQEDLESNTMDSDMVQKETPETDKAVTQTVDAQQEQNQEPAKATEDTQPESTENIPNVEVVAEEPARAQTPVEPNVNESDATPDAIDNTETDELAKTDAVHLDHIESFPEDKSVAEHTDEAVKVEDQQSNEADAMNAEVVQEEIPNLEETGVQEEMPQSENADESTTDTQQEVHQESAEETNDPVYEKAEETSHKSDMAASKEKASEHDATREVAVNIQVQNQESLEEMEATEAAMQQNSAASEEAIPEDHVATMEPSSDVQHIHYVEPEEVNCPGHDEESTNASNVASAEPAVEEKILPTEQTSDIQLEQTECTGTHETDEASDQTHAVVSNAVAQEDSVVASEPQVSETAEEPASVQTPVEPNVTESDATPDPIDSTETDELARTASIHEAITTDDSSLLKHGNEETKEDDQEHLESNTMDNDMVQKETLETDKAVTQIADAQQEQNQEPAQATEDTQPESTENIPSVEAVPEEPAGVQTPVEPNVNESDATPDAIDSTEAEELAKTDAVHLDHKESFPEDKSVAEHTDEAVKVEDPQCKQADAMDAEVVQEELPNLEETGVQEEMPKSENADESTTDTQEEVHQESAEETSDAVYEKAEETSHQSDMAASEEKASEHDATTREVAVNIQVQNQESLEEMEATEAAMQQSSAASEEAIPEGHVATTEPSSDVQHIHYVETEEANCPGHDEESTNKSNVASAELAVEEKILRSEQTSDIQLEQTECIGTHETDEASDQTHAVVSNAVAEEDSAAASEPQVTETAEEPVGVQTSVEPNVTESDATSDAIDSTETDELARTASIHEESTTDDSSLLKHGNEETKEDDQEHLESNTVDNDMVQKETLETEKAVTQKVDAQQEQNQEPAKATEDTQPERSENIPSVEVVPEEPTGVQTPVESNVNESDATPDAIDSTETNELAKTDVVHLDHKESFPEDKSVAEHTDEVVKVEDPQSNQADAMDAEVVQEEIPNLKETGVQEEMPKSENADESTTDTQQEVHQESAEETNDSMYEKAEETSHQSDMAASEEKASEHDTTTSEVAVNIQVQNQESLEETEASEAAMQQSSAASEEAIPEDHVATTEPSSDVQHMEPEEVNCPGHDEESTNTSNVASAEPAVEEKILTSEQTSDIQLEQTGCTGTHETDEASDQTHAVVSNAVAQEDSVAASEPQVTETEEVKDSEAIEAQEITQQGHVASSTEPSIEDDSTASEPRNDAIQQTLEQDSVEVKDTAIAETHHEEPILTSEEDKVEDNVTTEGPTCSTQEVDEVLSTEEIKENIAESIEEVSNVETVELADEDKNELRTDDIAEKHMQGLEPEEKSTEPIETEEASDQGHTPFNDSVQEDNTPESENMQMESTSEIKETEAIDKGANPQESNAFISEEPSLEDHITESETPCETQEVDNTESSEAIEGDKDTITREISDQSNMAFAGEPAQENNALSEPTADIKSAAEPESEEMKTEFVEVSETSHEMNAAAFQNPTQEDNSMASELHVVESAGEVSNIEASEAQATSHQSNVDQSDEKETEESITAGEPQILEPQSIDEANDSEATEPQSISQQGIISTSEDSVLEEIAKGDSVAIEPDVDPQQLQDQESFKLKELEANEPQGIVPSGIVSISDESTSEDNVTAIDTSSDSQADHLQSAEVIKDTEGVKSNAGPEEAAPEEHVQTEATIDISPMQEPELEEAKNTEPVGTEEDVTSSGLPAELTAMETTETEVPHDSPIVSIKEFSEDDSLIESAPHADIQQVAEEESVEDMRHTDTTENPEETQQLIGSTSDELSPTEEKKTVTEPACDIQQVHNVTAQEIKNSEDAKTDEPEESAQESNVLREPTADVQQVQDMGPTEETEDNEAMETEDHQQHEISTLVEPAGDNETIVDDQQVCEDKPAAVKDDEATKAEEVFKETNVTTPSNLGEETSELGSDPDFYVQPAQQIELSRDSEGSQPVKVEETSDESKVGTQETTTDDIVASEIDPPVDIKQEHELDSVEEIKGTNDTEAEENFHTSQPDALEKLASESNIAKIEPTSDIEQVNDFETTKEMKGVETINDGDISCEKTEIATSEYPSPTDNETALEEHPVESNNENMGNDADNATLVHEVKDEVQISAELKDDACDLGETAFTTQKSDNDEDAVQSSGEDILENANNIDQIKEEQKAGELLTESSTAEASQALLENDPQALEDVMDKDDAIKGGEQTSDQDSSKPGDIVLQLQTCESAVEEEAVKIINLDQQQKENEDSESQKEELQADEQKHEDKRDDVATEPLVEPQDIENSTTNTTEGIEVFEAEQTKEGVTETVKNESNKSKESTISTIHTKVEDTTGTDESAEEERPKDEQDNTKKDELLATDSTDKQDETTDEITNEELQAGLASSVEEISDSALSSGQIVENDPIAAQNVESGVHREDNECTNNVNNDVLSIQESDKDIVAEVYENKEMQNDDAAHHDVSQTKPDEEEPSQLCANEPYNGDTEMDDATTRYAEIIHDTTTIQPREIEEIGDVEKYLSIHHKVEDEKLATTEHNTIQVEAVQQKFDSSNADTNNGNQLSISNSLPEHKTETADDVLQLVAEEHAFGKIDETGSNEKTEATNTAATETATNKNDICDKTTGAEGALSDESPMTFDDTSRNLDVSFVVGASKDESMNEKMEDHKLDLPAHPTQDNTPEQGFCLEETGREMYSSEKPLPTKPEEQEENQIPKEQDEEDMHEPEIGDSQKEVEQDLPVSHFLMNLILGKENSDANGYSEPEAEMKQEETRDDNSCSIISQHEESLVSLPVENKVDDKLTFEENNDVKCSEETHEMVKEQDLKWNAETSLETDAVFSKNTHELETPAYQENSQVNISSELLSEEAAGVATKTEARDIEISNIELDNRAVDTVCHENMEVTTEIGKGSLKSNLDDVTNTKASEEATLGEGQTGDLPESLPEDRNVDAVSEQTPLFTESGMTGAKSLPSEADSVHNSVCVIQDKTIGSSNTGATSTHEIQLESGKVDKTEEKQYATTATGKVAEECVEISHDNQVKSTISEVTSDEQALQITGPVSDTETPLAHEKEISEGSIKGVDNCETAQEIQADSPNMHTNQDKQAEVTDNQTGMEPEKVGESNFQKHQETGNWPNSPKANDEGDLKHFATRETVIKEENVHGTTDSHTQTLKMNSNEEPELFDSKVQERDLNVVSPKEAPEAEENFLDVTKPESSKDEEQSPKEHDLNVVSPKEAPEAEENFLDGTKPEFSKHEEQSPKECDLNVVSPKEAPEAEENFVDVTKPEFSTEEEQTPKADKSNMADDKTKDEKTKDEEETRNFADEVTMKTETQGEGQKVAQKKHKLLSGVGSKVKQQLAKVKKAIVRKPGNTKPESPKS
ncbi:hypothetical protein ACP70R_028972 [Stipagrostis hirtigluma subsp. patula]